MSNDHDQVKQSIDCAFQHLHQNNSNNVKVIHKIIEKESWRPRIYSYEEDTVDGMEYKWFRFYLHPNDVDGLERKKMYLEADMIVQGNIAEFFEWNMNGHVVAAALYWEPLRNHFMSKSSSFSYEDANW